MSLSADSLDTSTVDGGLSGDITALVGPGGLGGVLTGVGSIVNPPPTPQPSLLTRLFGPAPASTTPGAMTTTTSYTWIFYMILVLVLGFVAWKIFAK